MLPVSTVVALDVLPIDTDTVLWSVLPLLFNVVSVVVSLNVLLKPEVVASVLSEFANAVIPLFCVLLTAVALLLDIITVESLFNVLLAAEVLTVSLEATPAGVVP